MDLPSVIRRRLKELKIGQKNLAAAADVTESYVSQLLSRKKAPPAPDRTDIYGRMEGVLRFPSGELAKLANLHRQADLKRKLRSLPRPSHTQFRELILRKCKAGERERIRARFESEPFGELERLVAQKLLDVAQRVVKQELENEDWLRRMARLTRRSYKQIRVTMLEFLDTDIVSVSAENCVSFLDPLIESWGIDLETFGMEIVLNRRLAAEPLKRFEFIETEPEQHRQVPSGLEEFLKDTTLSGDATKEEVEFLKALKLRGRQPTPLYYYREMQNLRDPLHFCETRAENESALNKRRLRARPEERRRGRKPGSANTRSKRAI